MFSVLAIGFISLGHAELERDFVEDQCVRTITENTETIVCEKTVTTETTATATQEDLTDEEKKVLDDIAEARENGSYVEPPRYDHKWGVPSNEPEPEKSTLVEHVERLCEKNKLSPSEKEVCRLAEALNLCYQGYGKLATVQKERSFEVTLEKPDIWKSWDLANKTLLKNMLLAYEECRATQTERDVVLSEMYANFVVDGIMEPQVYHAEMAQHQTPFKSQVITERTWLHTLGNAYEEICYSDIYPDSFKKQQGCPETEKVVDCYMPTDATLLALYDVFWPQFSNPNEPTIKQHYQAKYDLCVEKMANQPAMC
jgi:hypothetical protein